MDQQRRYDSLAPKGAFAATDAADAELAAAQTATLVASDAAASETIDASWSDDDDTPISTFSFDHEQPEPEDLCADDAIPVAAEPQSDRVSVEDAMRALIDLRLQRARPAEDFGTFEIRSAPGSVQFSADPPATHSLAPVELSRPAPATTKSRKAQSLSPLPMLAAAAVILLGVGTYRRLHRQPSAHATATQAAASLPTTPATIAMPTAAEPVAAPEAQPEASVVAEMQVLGVSESEYATLTLGTPTIVNIPAAVDAAEHSAARPTRAAKQTAIKDDAATAVAPKAETTELAKVAETPAQPAAALPEAPSREAILAGFNSVRETVLACANGNGGVAPIEATIVADGQVTHATVGGYYQGTPEGSCIARALRMARFEPFSRESIKVAFPFTL